MQNDSLVSIIIPVFNLELYLSNCLDSVLNQTYQNLEVLVVNDGSSDKSEMIIQEYSSRDPRVKGIKIKNSGVTCARHTGFKYCSGEFVVFVDGDDVLLNYSIEELVNGFSGCDEIDIVVSGYDRITETGNYLSTVYYENQVIERDKYRDFIFGIGNQGVPWGRIFRSSVISDSAFDFSREFSVREDALMNFIISNNVRKVKIIGITTYSYRVRDNSAASCGKDLQYYLDYYLFFLKLAKKNKVEFSNSMSVYCLRICVGIVFDELINNRSLNTNAGWILSQVSSNNVTFDKKTLIKLCLIKLSFHFSN
ncbi:glycosyltransferase family 2 protein [Vibrio splendidus]|uniref:glycosyltransferase family 2 protein n=1 Tax=Vibrio splendidus TaxID=29497 RepID=UPI00076A577F|nr:glycosyltransferase family 2 protein [Vibrio splendidus]